MNENDAKNILHKEKELKDIKIDYDKTKQLLIDGQFEELKYHIQSVALKYTIETCIYNTTHTEMPNSIEQSAYNCMNFLNDLYNKKSCETVHDILENIK